MRALLWSWIALYHISIGKPQESSLGPLTGDDGFGWDPDTLTPLWNTQFQREGADVRHVIVLLSGLIAGREHSTPAAPREQEVILRGEKAWQELLQKMIKEEGCREAGCVLLEADGCRVEEWPELESQNTLHLAPLLSHGTLSRMRGPPEDPPTHDAESPSEPAPTEVFLRVDVGQGYSTTLGIRRGEAPSAIAQRV